MRDATGDHLAYLPCGCVAMWASADMMQRDAKERTKFYRDCGKYGYRLVVVDANNPMPATPQDWECGRPTDQCDREKSKAKRKAKKTKTEAK